MGREERQNFGRVWRKIVLGVLLLLPAAQAWGTQTENLGFQILPAQHAMTIDGKVDDWDLSAGIFTCDDVENQRDDYATWLHGMYDKNNLYILARFLDHTPLNNPGQTIADLGFQGDCLQFRIITAPGTANERISHWTCWRGIDGKDVMMAQYGKGLNEETIKDAKTEGAQQAFTINADGKGYAQELAIPWKLLTKDGAALAPGSEMRMTFEPNFTVGSKSRMSLKDLFLAGVRPDRTFTFMATQCWGAATLAAKPGPVTPAAVRLSDGRMFAVAMAGGIPVVNWAGLVKSTELPGFKTIAFSTPEDGYVSLNIKAADGTLVRQLINGAFYPKGPHEVKWDGLTTPNFRMPGQPVPTGDYTWSMLFHTGIGLKLRGWAANGGSVPWDDGPTTNWGGDQGNPSAIASDAGQVYLGWSMAEAASSLLACDLDGNVKWKNKKGGISGVKGLAADGGVVYVLGGEAGEKSEGGAVYKLSAAEENYVPWGNGDSDLMVKSLWEDLANAPAKADYMAAGDGKLFLGFREAGKILVLDGASGKVSKTMEVPSPGAMAWRDKSLYVISQGNSVMRMDSGGTAKTMISNLANASALAVDQAGTFYVGTREPDNQVKIFDAEGKVKGTVGSQGGRPATGKWMPGGFRAISAVSVSSDGHLWVGESDPCPKRVSVWNAQDGTLVKEFFGSSPYGATGGAIDPLDPNIMTGLGCEWRLDPETGRAACMAVIDRDCHAARFGVGSNGHLYLATAGSWLNAPSPISIYERTGEAEYKLRARFTYDKSPEMTHYWADANGDGQEQPEEVTTVPGIISFNGWYMAFGQNMTFYSAYHQFKVTGFTRAGAPIYDLAHPMTMPHANEEGGMGACYGLGSADDSLVMYNGKYAADRSTLNVYDIASGKFLWSYPDDFVGVHGSHNAGPVEPGLIRGAFDFAGAAKLPAPIGNIWIIPTNVGEWHVLTGDGFYLTRLFQGDPLKVKWPAKADPGADMTDAPPGMGGEDFGGAMAQGKDGKLYLQAGKTGFWNLEVTGLETVKLINGGTVEISHAEAEQELAIRENQLQAVVGKRTLEVKRGTPNFTGLVENDFGGANLVSFEKVPEAGVRAAISWDDKNLYLGWEVKDGTPWINGAKTPEDMYVSGDTVDFQLGTRADADKARSEAGDGDLRISIGNFKGQATAVIYRKVSAVKKARTFSSGVVQSYVMDYVDVLPEAKVSVKMLGDGYCVEAVVPLAAIGFDPGKGGSFYGDLGATHGDSAGMRTRLRTYWNNQHTGLVDDAVFEVMMEPRNWGEMKFGE